MQRLEEQLREQDHPRGKRPRTTNRKQTREAVNGLSRNTVQCPRCGHRLNPSWAPVCQVWSCSALLLNLELKAGIQLSPTVLRDDDLNCFVAYDPKLFDELRWHSTSGGTGPVQVLIVGASDDIGVSSLLNKLASDLEAEEKRCGRETLRFELRPGEDWTSTNILKALFRSIEESPQGKKITTAMLRQVQKESGWKPTRRKQIRTGKAVLGKELEASGQVTSEIEEVPVEPQPLEREEWETLDDLCRAIENMNRVKEVGKLWKSLINVVLGKDLSKRKTIFVIDRLEKLSQAQSWSLLPQIPGTAFFIAISPDFYAEWLQTPYTDRPRWAQEANVFYLGHVWTIGEEATATGPRRSPLTMRDICSTVVANDETLRETCAPAYEMLQRHIVFRAKGSPIRIMQELVHYARSQHERWNWEEVVCDAQFQKALEQGLFIGKVLDIVPGERAREHEDRAKQIVYSLAWWMIEAKRFSKKQLYKQIASKHLQPLFRFPKFDQVKAKREQLAEALLRALLDGRCLKQISDNEYQVDVVLVCPDCATHNKADSLACMRCGYDFYAPINNSGR